MSNFLSFSQLSLRVKLVLSYLAVTLGAIFFLAFAIGIAIPHYFAATQSENLRHLADGYQNNLINPVYLSNGKLDGPTLAGALRRGPEPAILIITDAKGNYLLCAAPDHMDLNSICQNDQVQSALNQSLHENKAIEGDVNVTFQGMGTHTASARYLVQPLVENGTTIGAMFLSTPQPTPYPFLNEVNQTIFVAGIVIALLVVLFSLVLARRFTQPIEVLTDAAEQMKGGKYTQRVPTPRNQDELGLLAQTFNEMADTIESDVNELHRQEQFRRDLIANIAHDLATPLTAIQGFSEALADEVIIDPQARQETALRIGREVQRLRRLVADMQSMTALESGRTQLDLAPLHMQALVDETLAVIAPECEQLGITLQNEIAPDAPPVMADSDRITQVLLNLLDNARRHTPRGGTIEVGAAPNEAMLNVWVKDSGTGIDAKDLPYIFERFYRADRSRTTATGGSGLGLAIVKAMINAHHGRIWAQSAPGQGTIVTFTLPLALRPETKEVRTTQREFSRS